MPATNTSPLRPTGDLQGAIQSIQNEVLRMAAPGATRPLARVSAGHGSGSGDEANQPAEHISAPVDGARNSPRLAPRSSPDRVSSPQDRPLSGGARRNRKLPIQESRRRRPGPRVGQPEDQASHLSALVRSVAWSVRIDADLIARWTELLNEGVPDESELAIACRGIWAAQLRIEEAIRELDSEAGTSLEEWR